MTTTTRTPATILTLEAGDPRQVFTRPAQDGINQGRPATYRVANIRVYEDGSLWIWAEQLTKGGRAYKSGMGLTLGNEDRLAEIYGQDVADVVTEAVAEHARPLPDSPEPDTETAAPCQHPHPRWLRGAYYHCNGCGADLRVVRVGIRGGGTVRRYVPVILGSSPVDSTPRTR